MRIFWGTLVFILFLFLPAGAYACGNLRLSDWQSTYDMTGNTFPTLTFSAVKNGNSGCHFFVTCDYGTAATYSTRRLAHVTESATFPVQLCLDGACSLICKQLPAATNGNDVISGTFGSSPDKIALSFRPRLTTVDYQRFGTYQDSYTFKIYEGTLGDYKLKDSKTIQLTYVVSKKIDLSVLDQGGSFDAGATNKTVDFGALTTGTQSRFDLVLKFNAGYKVQLNSVNTNRLKHQMQNVYVPYTLNFNGSDVALSGNVTVAQGTGVSAPGGLRLPGIVTIGTVGTSPTGIYQDTINIQVSTTE